VHLLPANMRLQIFSLVSEAVANAAKHAVAKHVSVAVAAKQDEIRIRVRDDGRGFPFTGTYDLAALAHMQQGPSTLKARVAELGGDLRIISSSAGAQIDIRLPYETGT
jgi:signal transduction histidine kinase